ncbi:hypothetical protein BSY18_2364 [Blastomonas sp. RAC04]|nr:hypothetical protein BSY18_2364 [Blastomonas sp. RAC04]
MPGLIAAGRPRRNLLLRGRVLRCALLRGGSSGIGIALVEHFGGFVQRAGLAHRDTAGARIIVRCPTRHGRQRANADGQYLQHASEEAMHGLFSSLLGSFTSGRSSVLGFASSSSSFVSASFSSVHSAFSSSFGGFTSSFGCFSSGVASSFSSFHAGISSFFSGCFCGGSFFGVFCAASSQGQRESGNRCDRKNGLHLELPSCSNWLITSPKGVKHVTIVPTSFRQAPTVGPAHLAPVFRLCNHFGWESRQTETQAYKSHGPRGFSGSCPRRAICRIDHI